MEEEELPAEGLEVGEEERPEEGLEDTDYPEGLQDEGLDADVKPC